MQGKSISLICGALAWLTKHTDEFGLLRSDTVASASSSVSTESSATDAIRTSEPPRKAEPSWLAAFDETNAQRVEQQQQAQVKAALRGVEQVRSEPSEGSKKRKVALAHNHHARKRPRLPSSAAAARSNSAPASQDDGDEHLVDAYDSDRAAHQRQSSDSESDAALTAKPQSRYGIDERPNYGIVKIIYCSRTHSQISQFVREIRKTPFGDRVRVVSLGSRKNLCTNASVTALRSDVRMTDKCLDMLQGSKASAKAKAKTAKCPFYERELLGHFRDYALVRTDNGDSVDVTVTTAKYSQPMLLLWL